MDFELTEEHKLIRETTREFAQKRILPKAFEMDENEEVPSELLKELGELGYFGLQIPEEYGGLNLDDLSYVISMEELAKASAGVEIVVSAHNSLFCTGIVDFGSEFLKKKYLPHLAKGEFIGAYCLTEPSSGTDAGSLKATAVLKGDHYVLNGTKSFVTNAGIARVFLVFALTSPELRSHGISCFLVERDTPGLALGAKEKKLGIKASDTREVSLSDVKVPRENLLGEENSGFKIALAILNSGRLGVGGQAVGIAQAALDEALKYSKQRKQFGKFISEFEAIQFKLADMATKIEAARLMVYRAAWMKAKNLPCVKEVSMAKLFASEVANWVVNEAVQIHGGYGYIKEYAVERYFRDARITEIYEGTSEAQRIVISRSLLE